LEMLGRVERAKTNMLRNVAGRVKSIGNRGCDSGCDNGCGCGNSCGCGNGAAPTCGCEVNACNAAPACCDSGCGAPKCGLLSRLFARKSACDTGCDTGCSTCNSCSAAPAAGTPAPAPAVSGDAAPMPPAPVVDPSAYLNSNRRVIQATSYVR
jgi:hypothetical protein